MTSTSTLARICCCAHSHAVPPTSRTPAGVNASLIASLESVDITRSIGSTSVGICSVLTLRTAARSVLRSSSARTLCELAVTPTRKPASSRSRMRCCPAYVLPDPGGPCTARTCPDKSKPHRRTTSTALSPSFGSRPGGTTRSNKARPAAPPPASICAPRSFRASRSTTLLTQSWLMSPLASTGGLPLPRLISIQPSSRSPFTVSPRPTCAWASCIVLVTRPSCAGKVYRHTYERLISPTWTGALTPPRALRSSIISSSLIEPVR